MLKYGKILYSIFPNKTITSRIDTYENLIEGLENNIYDFIFTTYPIKMEGIATKFILEEALFISLPRNHFIAKLTNGVHFSEIDGQSFLVADNIGVWKDIIEKHMPNSKFFKQTFDDLYEIVNSSTLPSFSTNITSPSKIDLDRIDIPILDDDAKIDFYISYKIENKQKISNFLRLVE